MILLDTGEGGYRYQTVNIQPKIALLPIQWRHDFQIYFRVILKAWDEPLF
jgi:hypothetical protein